MAKNSSNLLKKYKEDPSRLTAEQKDKLILEYAPLIKFIAQKIAVRLPPNIEIDDLISSGVIGLMVRLKNMTRLEITHLKPMLSSVFAVRFLTNCALRTGCLALCGIKRNFWIKQL